MDTLFALALSTPIWGFSLQPPVMAAPDVAAAQVAQVEVVEAEVPPDLRVDRWQESHNASMMNWTRAFQISTTIAMAATGALGFIQFHDEYGFHDDYVDTQCGLGAQGDPILDYCGEETPWPHLIGAGARGAAVLGSLFVATAGDFDRASRRDADWRVFEVTRWVALGLGVLQGAAGALLANAQRAGWLTYEDDFDLMQGLAITHMALGAANVGMNLANTILIF
jgi:hypothetical protein